MISAEVMISVEVMIFEDVINEVIIICFFEDDASMKIKHSSRMQAL